MSAWRSGSYMKRDIVPRPFRKQSASARREKEKLGSDLVPEAQGAAALRDERKQRACRHMNFLSALVPGKAWPKSA
jgi:hypothetical protein